VAAVNETAVRLTKAESKAHLQGEIAQLFNHAGIWGAASVGSSPSGRGITTARRRLNSADFVGGCHHTYLRWWMPRQAEWLRWSIAVVALVDLTGSIVRRRRWPPRKERLTVTLRAEWRKGWSPRTRAGSS